MYSKLEGALAVRLGRARGCGCLSLRLGALIAALVVILHSVLALSQLLAEMSSWSAGVEGVGQERVGVEGAGEAPPGALQWAQAALALAVLAANIALSALMLVGVLREKAWMLQPWVVFRALQLLAAGALFVAGGARLLAAGAPGTLLLLLAEFLAILINFYMLTVVTSYWRELLEMSDEATRLRQLDRDTWYTAV